MKDHDVHGGACAPERLVRLTMSADPSALDQITRCYAERLLRAGRRHCRSPSEAEDAVQDALLIAAEQLGSFRGEGSLEGWLIRIVARACQRIGRGRKNDPALHDQELVVADEDPEGPETEAARLELGRLLEMTLLELDPRDRTILLLAEIEGHSAAEIGTELGMTEGAVRTRLSRLRPRVRQALAPFAGDDL